MLNKYIIILQRSSFFNDSVTISHSKELFYISKKFFFYKNVSKQQTRHVSMIKIFLIIKISDMFNNLEIFEKSRLFCLIIWGQIYCF